MPAPDTPPGKALPEPNGPLALSDPGEMMAAMRFAAWSWALFVMIVAAGVVGVRRLLCSFRRWPPTESERTSFIWARRGGGDM